MTNHFNSALNKAQSKKIVLSSAIVCFFVNVTVKTLYPKVEFKSHKIQAAPKFIETSFLVLQSELLVPIFVSVSCALQSKIPLMVVVSPPVSNPLVLDPICLNLFNMRISGLDLRMNECILCLPFNYCSCAIKSEIFLLLCF